MVNVTGTNEHLKQEFKELQQKYDALKAFCKMDYDDFEHRERAMNLLTHAIRSISECVSITDMEDRIIFVNDAFLKTYQYEEDELIGQSISIVRSDNNLPEITKTILPQTLLGGWQGEIINRRKDGLEFPVFISTSVIRNFKDEPIALIGITSDITERKKAEKALLESEIRMRSITDSAQDAILMMDASGNISYWNPAAERIFGYTRDESMGLNLHALLVPKRYHQSHLDHFPAFQQTGEGNAVGKTLDLEALKKDGSEISIQLSLSAIQIDGQWHSVGIIRDITQQKKIEQALLLAKQEAEMANKFKSIFLANMSHEIRTPLNAIIGFSQLMNRDQQLSKIQKEYNVSIIHAGEHLLALINDILELSKIEAGRVVVTPTNTDFLALLDEVEMIFKERVQSKKLKYITDFDEDIPRYIVVDGSKLRQIFVNLIGNALKFTDEGGIAVRCRIDQSADEQELLVVEIQDSGTGIAAEELNKLFKHFEQTSSGISKGSGTGLGLALSKELATLMGGDITVSSRVGIGSIFTFSVKIERGQNNQTEKRSVQKVLGIENSETQYRILVVDDKKDNLMVAATLLQLVGFETLEAVNGEDAIEKFKSWHPHLILMDMRMPVMDGYEAIRIIKSTEAGLATPIVALTASTFEDELKKINELGIQGYVRKPFRENELFDTIGNILNIKYLYNEELTTSKLTFHADNHFLADELVKISNSLLLKMQNALAIADIDLLIDLIKSIAAGQPELAGYLTELAENYDYDQLKLILHGKENKG